MFKFQNRDKQHKREKLSELTGIPEGSISKAIGRLKEAGPFTIKGKMNKHTYQSIPFVVLD